MPRCGRCHAPMAFPPPGQLSSGVCGEVKDVYLCNGLIENTPEEKERIARDPNFRAWLRKFGLEGKREEDQKRT